MRPAASRRRVVVTGYGMITALGENAETTFNRAARSESGVAEIRSFDTRGLTCRIGGEVDDSWINLPPNHAAGSVSPSRGSLLMQTAAREAQSMAHLDQVPHRDRVGTILGSHGQNPAVEQLALLHHHGDRETWDRAGLSHAPGYDLGQFFRRRPDVATGELARQLGNRGPCLSIVSACSAGAQAIGEGVRLIREGRSDVVVAGGCDSTMNFVGMVGFTLLRVLAERWSTPETASRPFDRKRCGFVMSEGAGVVVFEEYEHALARKADVRGEILGYGDSADAHRITDARPDGQGAALAMCTCLEDAAVKAAAIEAISAHATSTVQGDIAECRAIEQVFGSRARSIPVSAPKSMLGHTIAAAGAIELILALMGMERSILLPTINQQVRDKRCALDTVPNEARHQKHRLAISNSFGFGGQNACLCIGLIDA